MIGRLAALIFLSSFSLIQTLEVPDQISLTVAELGDDLTLTCTIPEDKPALFYWYRIISFGYMIQRVAKGSFDKLQLEGQFDTSRFMITAVGGVYALTIRNVSKEDEAAYFCQVGTVYTLSIMNSTLLTVKDPKNQLKSIQVKQSPDEVLAELGGTVTLECSLLSKNEENTDQCPGEHSVHWFRSGSGSYPSMVYTDSTISEDQEERSCVYRLSKTIQSSSDSGTYYCAVASCGEILFGEGTIVETRQLWPTVYALGTLLGCCVLVIIGLILTRKPKPICKHCEGEAPVSNHAEQDRSVGDHPSNVDGEAEQINYVALDFPSRKAKRWKNKREPPEDSMYSNMREYR